MGVKENMKLMMTLDDAWNDQDWETFKKRHAANVAVYWPGQPEPTKGEKHITKKLSNSSKRLIINWLIILTRFFSAMATLHVLSRTGQQP